ncbi:hypothetical protein CI109_106742 [Kwoniella shandongensis]|uniref:Uncharacterized protein n=1 Tax=Kwoniella shandongensis TaxID=1734106 RepID=A0A5M6C7F0_9TREE|nr:uncharacterized protein CI109_001001 [Kwoniella shandongensis]KAA5530821.1 hypothetical protein CI109_001001 [Kwoniella shandongensis]
MASSSASRIAQLKPLIRSLPPSPFSTNVQLSEALESIVSRTASATSATAGVGSSSAASEALREAGNQRTLQQMKEAVMRIKSGTASRDYPLSDILTPPNDVHYYTRIRNAVHNAENGIKRPWWKTFFSVKGEE